MKVEESLSSLRKIIKQWRAQGLSVGFVPTMGHLHAGHISLVNAARVKNDKVVVSIFVNPLQFNESSDFSAYPKTLEDDQNKLTDAEADLLYMPDVLEMYPQGQDSVSKLVVPEVGDELEGACRPGHFNGVATVVLKLFNQVQPDRAFFGEKDFQQLLLVRKMVRDLDLDVEIESVATQREDDGLAMSSRNSRLTVEQRKIASGLNAVLSQVVEKIKTGSTNFNELEIEAKEKLRELGFGPEYISVRDCTDLKPASGTTVNKIVLGAAKLGDVRLIDNLM